MDQVKHTMLIAQAKAEIVAFILKSIDVSTLEAQKLKSVEEIEASFGFNKGEAKTILAKDIPLLRKQLNAYAEEKAGEEIVTAIKEAEETRNFWTEQFARFNAAHASSIECLYPLPSDTDEEFRQIVIAGRDKLLDIANNGHAELGILLKRKEKLLLHHCFHGHHVDGVTSNELAKLYMAS